MCRSLSPDVKANYYEVIITACELPESMPRSRLAGPAWSTALMWRRNADYDQITTDHRVMASKRLMDQRESDQEMSRNSVTHQSRHFYSSKMHFALLALSTVSHTIVLTVKRFHGGFTHTSVTDSGTRDRIKSQELHTAVCDAVTSPHTEHLNNFITTTDWGYKKRMQKWNTSWSIQ